MLVMILGVFSCLVGVFVFTQYDRLFRLANILSILDEQAGDKFLPVSSSFLLVAVFMVACGAFCLLSNSGKKTGCILTGAICAAVSALSAFANMGENDLTVYFAVSGIFSVLLFVKWIGERQKQFEKDEKEK